MTTTQPTELGIDPAFTAPERAALVTRNAPDPADVVALVADRDRLRAWLTPGYALWRRAMTTHREDYDVRDPIGGRKSNDEDREHTLASYQWFAMYGATLLMLVDRALLGGALVDHATQD